MRPEFSAEFWRDRRVLITGHTGFKGSWLALSLLRAGAQVCGYALPAASPSLFAAAGVEQGLTSGIGDVRHARGLVQFLQGHRPEVVFHLAAQALVGASYQDPLGTYGTNVLGTANMLEAVRQTPSVRAVVVVTSDKCYENRDWIWGYREVDRLGGHDPYSNSKACAELVTAAYRDSFFSGDGAPAVASARAGNVIGGGDWAHDRLIPDAMRAFLQGRTLDVRHPEAIRPWQHVLEPVGGYLRLAQALLLHGRSFAGAWNFGPNPDDALPVGDVLDRVIRLWGDSAAWRHVPSPHYHEAGCLRLACAKAQVQLGWRPAWTLQRGLTATINWYRAFERGEDMRRVTVGQIDEFSRLDQPASVAAHG